MHLPNLAALMLFGLIAFGAFVLAIYLVVGRPSQPESTMTVITQERSTTEVQTVPTTTVETVPAAPSPGATTPPPSTTEGTSRASSACSGATGNALYAADWSGGMDGWAGSSDWSHVDGMLTDDGSPGDLDTRITAPCQPPTSDYALEAQIQLVDPQCGFGTGRKEFGLIARSTGKGGVLGGVDCNKAKIASTQYNPTFALDRETVDSENFSPGGDWHDYRLEVQGDEIRLLVDGSLLFDKASNRNLSGSKVGMFSHGAQINVKSFKIEKL